jgi:TetR/AcrR family transcriptional regulator, regulator of biofilm formation and stress response
MTGGGTAKGARRRELIAAAAAALVLEQGPGALSHRAVAARAGVPLAATTYYFRDLDDLAAQAGGALVDGWATHAREVLDGLDRAAPIEDPAEVLVRALLPPGDDTAVRAHHEQVLALGRNPRLAAAVGASRFRLDVILRELTSVALAGTGAHGLSPALVLAVLDGAVVAAVSEGQPVRGHAHDLVAELIAAAS